MAPLPFGWPLTVSIEGIAAVKVVGVGGALFLLGVISQYLYGREVETHMRRMQMIGHIETQEDMDDALGEINRFTMSRRVSVLHALGLLREVGLAIVIGATVFQLAALAGLF